MSVVRRALPGDAEEILRLRQVMIDSMFAPDPSVAWHGESGAPACLVAGTIDYRIGRAGDPQGMVGFVFSVATDPDARRRGYARACTTALLEWFRGRGVRRVQLTASAEAEPLYISLGFRPKPNPLLELAL